MSNGISDMWGVLTKKSARARVCPIKTICILPLSSVQTSLSFPIFHFSELFFISIIRPRSSRAHTSNPAPLLASPTSPPSFPSFRRSDLETLRLSALYSFFSLFLTFFFFPISREGETSLARAAKNSQRDYSWK